MILLISYVLLALVVSFLCSLLESTLLTVTPSTIEAARQRGAKWGPRMQSLKRNVDRPLSAILTLNTIAHTMGAAGAGAEYARLYGNVYEAVFAGALTLSILVVTEIIPKSLGAHYAPQLAPGVSWLLPWLIRILAPLVWLSQKLTSLITLGRARPVPRHREELLAVARLGEEAGALQEQERLVIKNLINLGKTRVENIMTPRAVVFSLPQDTPLAEFPKIISGQPFSRIPVYDKNPDLVTGFVLRTDALMALHEDPETKATLVSVRRPMAIASEKLQADRLFQRLVKERQQIMLVVEEHGVVVGLVTLEDVVETIFGFEIIDEDDHVADLQAYARELWKERAARMGLKTDDAGNLQID